MADFPEAMNRLFTNVFVCRRCKSKIRADSLKVRKGQVHCRKCKSSALRPKHKEAKGSGGTAAPGAAPAAAAAAPVKAAKK